MFINTLIVSILLAAIMLLPIILKAWLDPTSKTDDKEPEQTDSSKHENIACGGCGLKNIATCSVAK